MVNKEAERLPRPDLPSPVSNPGGGGIKVIVSGRLKVTSTDKRISIVRKG